MAEGLRIDDPLFSRISDLSISPRQYYELVGHFNLLIQTELTKKLSENADRLGSSVTLVTPGSDARLEKGSHISPLAIIAIVNSDLDLDLYERTLTDVLNEVATTRISKVVEVKGPDTPFTTFNFHGTRRVQPGRIADSRLIYGSPDDLQRAKVKLGQEIISLSSKNIVDQVSNLKKDARKATERGRNKIAGTDAMHFDLETGLVYFNPEAYQLSFKIGPLRLVQNTLLLEEIRHTRRENDASFISTLDSNIVNRLDQLASDQMINLTKDSVREIMEHYAFFLRLYHRSENAYSINGQVVIQLSKSESDGISRRLQALSELMKKLKIQRKPR